MIFSPDAKQRIAIGIAAAGGLITAACISGLPTTSCAALAETYVSAILLFGSTAAMALICAAGFFVYSEQRWDTRKGFSLRKFYWQATPEVAFWLSGVSLALSILLGAVMLKRAVLHCYVGSDAELSSRVHQWLGPIRISDWATIIDIMKK